MFKQETDSRPFILALIGITVIAFLVRLVFLSQPIRLDEANTFLYFARSPLKFIITNYDAPNNHVLHTVFVYLVTNVLGNQPWIIRIPALIAGVLIVPATYLVAVQWYDHYSALLSAGLVASSSILIEYSTNARGYTLLCLISLILLALAFFLKQNKNNIGWLSFVLLASLGFYTIPIMLYPFGMIMVWLLISSLVKDVSPKYGNDFWKYLLVAGGAVLLLTVLLYLPIFLNSGVEAVIGNRFVNPENPDQFRIDHTLLVWSRDLPLLLIALLGVGVIISQVFHQRLTLQRISLMLAAVLWIVPLVWIQNVSPWPRVWLYQLPVVIIWASVGVIGLLGKIKEGDGFVLRGWRTPVFIMGVMIGTILLCWNVASSKSILMSTETGAFREAEKTALFLKDKLKPGDVVLSELPSNYPLQYYFLLHDVPNRQLIPAKIR